MVKKGSSNGRAKLSEPDILEIKKLYSDKMGIAAIARKFGVGWTTISHVLKNETWNK
jgi:DNA invertase Pin-like site-specific DNA recombinase